MLTMNTRSFEIVVQMEGFTSKLACILPWLLWCRRTSPQLLHLCRPDNFFLPSVFWFFGFPVVAERSLLLSQRVWQRYARDGGRRPRPGHGPMTVPKQPPLCRTVVLGGTDGNFADQLPTKRPHQTYQSIASVAGFKKRFSLIAGFGWETSLSWIIKSSSWYLVAEI